MTFLEAVSYWSRYLFFLQEKLVKGKRTGRDANVQLWVNDKKIMRENTQSKLIACTRFRYHRHVFCILKMIGAAVLMSSGYRLYCLFGLISLCLQTSVHVTTSCFLVSHFVDMCLILSFCPSVCNSARLSPCLLPDYTRTCRHTHTHTLTHVRFFIKYSNDRI